MPNLRLPLLLSTTAAAALAACGHPGLTGGTGGSASSSVAGTGGAGTGTGGSTGTGGGMTGSPVPTTTCTSTLPAPPSGVCGLTKGSGVKVVRGRVVAPDKIYEGGEIVVDATGKIACVACDCSSTAGYQGATTLSCPGGVISPALINTHDHITYAQNSPKPATVKYDHRSEWRIGLNGKPKIPVPKGSPVAEVTAWGELRFVLGGATATAGSGGVQGLLRNLDRAEPLQEGLAEQQADFQTFPLQDLSGTLLTTCTYPASSIPDSQVDGDSAFLPHISEGVIDAARNEFVCTDGAMGSQRNYLKHQTAMIHAIGLEPGDIDMMAKNSVSLIWSPRSNITLYGFTASVTEMARAGVRIGLGTDWSASGSMNLLRELACADSYNKAYLHGFFTNYELYRMVTEDAAAITASQAKIGQLKVGLFADVTVWNGGKKDVFDAIVHAGMGDVALVLRGGLVLYGEAPLVDALSPDGGTGCEAISVCGSANKLCAMREVGKTTATLQADIMAGSGEAYPLFFCGTPMNEPSCIPSRPNEFTGMPTAGDQDGDGIPDAKDLCPTVFSAIRPVDHGMQADADGDGVGDACDPCPLSKMENCNTHGH